MNFNTTYAVGNELFARQCFILGWCVWSFGYDPKPITGLEKNQVEYLRGRFVGSLYPDELKKAIQDRLDVLNGKDGVLANLTNTDNHSDKPLTPAVLSGRHPDLDRGERLHLISTPIDNGHKS